MKKLIITLISALFLAASVGAYANQAEKGYCKISMKSPPASILENDKVVKDITIIKYGTFVEIKDLNGTVLYAPSYNVYYFTCNK